jgi:hypothetical protein
VDLVLLRLQPPHKDWLLAFWLAAASPTFERATSEATAPASSAEACAAST